ncbi:hypothetical protein [Endozoicomonas ascidiicola]|uniref:hypothetical protein n=1 Tax=Endozoicomonas ascidiicola TaxID=1698521 RepID=UPI00082F3F2D|nr:hypothetical protein [Endozoicomonas ascidiicola]
MAELLKRVSTADYSDNWIDLKTDNDTSEIVRISFNDELPYISPLFCERILSALMAEVQEQIAEWRDGKHYQHQMTYFDRKRVERIASKIINDMKGGISGL